MSNSKIVVIKFGRSRQIDQCCEQLADLSRRHKLAAYFPNAPMELHVSSDGDTIDKYAKRTEGRLKDESLTFCVSDLSLEDPVSCLDWNDLTGPGRAEHVDMCVLVGHAGTDHIGLEDIRKVLSRLHQQIPGAAYIGLLGCNTISDKQGSALFTSLDMPTVVIGGYEWQTDTANIVKFHADFFARYLWHRSQNTLGDSVSRRNYVRFSMAETYAMLNRKVGHYVCFNFLNEDDTTMTALNQIRRANPDLSCRIEDIMLYHMWSYGRATEIRTFIIRMQESVDDEEKLRLVTSAFADLYITEIKRLHESLLEVLSSTKIPEEISILVDRRLSENRLEYIPYFQLKYAANVETLTTLEKQPYIEAFMAAFVLCYPEAYLLIDPNCKQHLGICLHTSGFSRPYVWKHLGESVVPICFCHGGLEEYWLPKLQVVGGAVQNLRVPDTSADAELFAVRYPYAPKKASKDFQEDFLHFGETYHFAVLVALCPQILSVISHGLQTHDQKNFFHEAAQSYWLNDSSTSAEVMYTALRRRVYESPMSPIFAHYMGTEALLECAQKRALDSTLQSRGIVMRLLQRASETHNNFLEELDRFKFAHGYEKAAIMVLKFQVDVGDDKFYISATNANVKTWTDHITSKDNVTFILILGHIPAVICDQIATKLKDESLDFDSQRTLRTRLTEVEQVVKFLEEVDRTRKKVVYLHDVIVGKRTAIRSVGTNKMKTVFNFAHREQVTMISKATATFEQKFQFRASGFMDQPILDRFAFQLGMWFALSKVFHIEDAYGRWSGGLDPLALIGLRVHRWHALEESDLIIVRIKNWTESLQLAEFKYYQDTTASATECLQASTVTDSTSSFEVSLTGEGTR
jgi:hypothetical protein